MKNVTQLLSRIEGGDPAASEQLLPLVYGELRKLATARLAQESPGQTLQGTALFHEAYLRLVDDDKVQHWDSRGHFFAAAAEAMRRILVDQARTKKSLRRGGGLKRKNINTLDVQSPVMSGGCLAVHAALEKFEKRYKLKADLVKLRYFGGFSAKEAAQALGISTATAERYWAFSRAWLHDEIERGRVD